MKEAMVEGKRRWSWSCWACRSMVGRPTHALL